MSVATSDKTTAAKNTTTEQRELLRWTASLGAITAPALALRLDVSVASARARLAAAQRRGLLTRTRPLADQPALFTITRSGLRACEAPAIEPCRVSRSSAHHLIVCALVAAALERCYPDHAVIGERELRLLERERGAPVASARLRWGEDWDADLHRPDLVLLSPAGSEGQLPVAVEVELTAKSPRRLAGICRAWARCRLVAGVIYLATPEVERALLRAVTASHSSEQVAVVPLTALPGCEVS